MRIDTNAINITLSPEQREYARARLWSATRVAAGRVAWAGLWLAGPESTRQGATECRITAWLSGSGPVSVSQNAEDALVAIDLAASRLEHALRRRVGGPRAGLRARCPRRAGARARRSRRGRAMPASPATRTRAGHKTPQLQTMSGLFKS
ncbi:MAG TPA: HPF/RaiA family ribosome-associated protein [Tepidisphaeraceae bacterium]|nr:HPF/RaiA family ribosome-associated protein [Tepidisphaeraceae bacterium]